MLLMEHSLKGRCATVSRDYIYIRLYVIIYSKTCEPCQIEMREKFHSFSTLSETADLPHLYRGKNRFYHSGNAVSHPRVCGENLVGVGVGVTGVESSPRVWGKCLLTRLNAPPTHISHSLYAMDELRIFLNGDPQTN